MAIHGDQTDEAVVRSCQQAIMDLDEAIAQPFIISRQDDIDISEARNRLLAVIDSSVANHIRNQIAS